VWTANYVLMKSLGAMNRIPYGDAGLNQALAQLAGIGSYDSKTVDRIFAPYEGWKTYLVYYLWRSRREMA
jgi:DNA-3-methyladenine glycosylase II